MPDAVTPAHPYPDYLDRLDEIGDRYLVQLLKLRNFEKEPDDESSKAIVQEFQIIDIIQKRFEFHNFTPPLIGPVDNRPQSSKVRFMIFRHKPKLLINPNYIIAISSKFHLDNDFLKAHFGFCEMHESGVLPCAIPEALPKARSYLQILCSSVCHFTTVFLGGNGFRTSLWAVQFL